MPISVDVEVRITSPNALMGEHYRSRANRRAKERSLTLTALEAFEPPQLKDGEQLVVTFTRCGPLKLDDDNLAFSFKSIRDATADWLGIDDADPRIKWQYEQEKHREKTMVRRHRKKVPGFRCYCRIDVSDAGDAEPVLEKCIGPGEVAYRRQPPIHWRTQPGVDLGAVPPRVNGTTVKVVRKKLTAKGAERDYVHIAVYYDWMGRPTRSQGVAILISELPYVLAALQSVPTERDA